VLDGNPPARDDPTAPNPSKKSPAPTAGPTDEVPAKPDSN